MSVGGWTVEAPLGEFIPELFPDVVAQALHSADDAGLANLFVHQFQIAVSELLRPDQTGNCYGTGDPHLFGWNRTRPPVSELETYARNVVKWAMRNNCNHASAHVAVAGLAQLSRLLREPAWNLGSLNGYKVLP